MEVKRQVIYSVLLGRDSLNHEEDHRPTDGEKGDPNHPEAMEANMYGGTERG